MKKDRGLMDVSTPCEGQRHTDIFTKVLFLTVKIQKIRLIIETILSD